MVQNLKFETVTDRLPPQNIEAEEAILGGILLDPEAISRVMEILTGEAFYIGAHRDIYRAALELHTKGQPTDLMTVTVWLKDHNKLDKVGGQVRLAQLVDRTISAANIDQYATLVMDKYTRRLLIQAGGEVAQLGYDTSLPLEEVLDQAEQKLFNITQVRPQGGLTATSDILIDTFSEIEQRSLGVVLPGVPCGFYDLDAMTQGFQRSDLIICAGRPSMGKCLSSDTEIVLADGRLKTIGEIYQTQSATLLTLGADWRFRLTQPSAYVDDGIKPVYRVRTSTGRVIETTLSHPYLTISGWRSLAELQVGKKVAVPRELPIFGCQSLPEHQVKLLGYLIGDGGLTNRSPRFTNENPRIQQDFAAAALQFPGVKITSQDSGGTRTLSMSVVADTEQIQPYREVFADRLKQHLKGAGHSADWLARQLQVSTSLIYVWMRGQAVPSAESFEQLCEALSLSPADLVPDGLSTLRWMRKNAFTTWLQELGIWGCSAHDKFIPGCVFQLPQPQLALFLNRLFATDGWATVLSSGQVQLGFASVSERLVRQIQHLLLRFGVIARLKPRSVLYQEQRRPAYQLDITDALSIKTFAEEIGIFGKEAALDRAITQLARRRYQSNRDLIPVEIWERLKAAKGNESWQSLATRAGLQGTSNIHVGTRSLKRERLFALATALENHELQAIATSDVYWDEIVEITPVGDKQVYDLTIPVTHNFVANDICVHNTAICLNIARNIAALQKLPVAVFSLEMSKLQLVYRLLSSEVEMESSRLRTGRIAQHEWEKLGHAISVLSQMPVFIDDTPNASVTEMRSKCRRLQAEHGGALGLILIDYLQLMEGSSDNRVQELSKITRSLKGLARELNVPIIALSQLSRGVESRTNKRPMMSDLRESGCLSGETFITLADTGQRIPIKELLGQQNFAVWALNENTYKIERAIVTKAFSTGIKPVFKLVTRLGRSIRATGNHPFRTLGGWKRLDTLEVGDRLALPRTIPGQYQSTLTDAELGLLGHLIGDGCTLPRHVIQYTTREADLAEKVVNLALAVFGDAVVPRIQQERQWYQVYLPASQHLTHKVRNPIAKWLDDLGVFGLRSHEKYIPAAIFEQPIHGIATFLRHLWSTDGCIKLVELPKPRPIAYYATSSSRLAQEVQFLLLRLGVNARFKQVPQGSKGHPQYHVIITGKGDLEIFIDVVGAVGDYKLRSIREISFHLKERVTNTNRDIIPRDVWHLYALPEMKASGITQRKMQAEMGMAYCGTSLHKQNLSRERMFRLATVLDSSHLLKLASSDLYWDEVVSIEADGVEEVFDLTVNEHHNFIANEIIVHNSIEQDADLIMMLYREEYYEPDTPDRGIAEVIVTKHRNGPTGTVKLLFEPQFTRFRNLANPNA
jgi:replicative DNA helicase